jgi:error-prone DNA polymerase
MVSRMVERGYDAEFAARCFNQIKGFGEYGFPESHAASFAHLVYVSSWLKCHHPAVFACALLNSQPMGFYAPAQIVRDAREHGVEVRPPDVNFSGWDSTLEESLRSNRPLPLAGEDRGPPSNGEAGKVRGAERHALTSPIASRSGPFLSRKRERTLALRLGLREVDGLKQEDARTLLALGGGRSIAGLHARGVPVPALEKLAAADCFRSLGLDRRAALWEVKALARSKPLPLFAFAEARDQGEEPGIALPSMPLSEHVVHDYQTLRLSLKAHPMSFLRDLCRSERITDNERLKSLSNGAPVSVAGVVLVRQRPGSARGVVFLTLEDEVAVCNAVVWPQTLEQYRAIVMGARLMLIRGRVQRTADIIHVVAERIEDRTAWLSHLTGDQSLLRNPLARADEVRKGGPGGSARGEVARHPRQARIIPKSRDFH